VGAGVGPIHTHGNSSSRTTDGAALKRFRLNPGASASSHGYAAGQMDMISTPNEPSLATVSKWMEDIRAAQIAFAAYKNEVDKLIKIIKLIPLSEMTEECFSFVQSCARSVSKM
jgi:hypothetical protein